MSANWREAMADAIEMQAERIEASAAANRDCLGLWETGSEMDSNMRKTISLMEDDAEKRRQLADEMRGPPVVALVTRKEAAGAAT